MFLSDDLFRISKGEEKAMKTGNVILAIFLWLCIPSSIGAGFLLGVFSGNIVGGLMCAIGAPLIFFILGLIALLSGMEKKPQAPSSQPVAIQQPIKTPSIQQQETIQQPVNNDRKIEETSGSNFSYNRNDLIFGIVFIAIGIIIEGFD